MPDRRGYCPGTGQAPTTVVVSDPPVKGRCPSCGKVIALRMRDWVLRPHVPPTDPATVERIRARLGRMREDA